MMLEQKRCALVTGAAGGMGTAIAKALVEAHGGGISVTSPGAGKGAVFTVRLPGAKP